MRDSKTYGIHYRIFGLNTLLTKLIKHYFMKAYEGVAVYIDIFLISALPGVE
jgi:hypothetical protein